MPLAHCDLFTKIRGNKLACSSGFLCKVHMRFHRMALLTLTSYDPSGKENFNMKLLIVDDEESALRDLERTICKTVPDAEIRKTDTTKKAIALCRESGFDVAFLDIRMPGTDGLDLARKLTDLRPMMNIVMVTAFEEYSLDALRLYVSDYILKPALPEDIRRALNHLRIPVMARQSGLFVQCFGNFEVFYDGAPVRFGRAKVKEFFAYLIDRKGAAATNAEIRAILWMDETNDSEKQRKYFAQIVYELQNKLEELGLSDVFLHNRDAYSVVPERIPCDYYQALNRDPGVLTRYEGEYMNQYEWAARRIGWIEKRIQDSRYRNTEIK